MLRTKSVHSPIQPLKDGLRILATRNRGRYLPKTAYDIWMANLGPSEELLHGFQAGQIGWGEFSRRCRAEMREIAPVDRRNAHIKNHGQKFTLRLLKELSERGIVTLLYHCAEDQQRCPPHILKSLIEST